MAMETACTIEVDFVGCGWVQQLRDEIPGKTW
jgi:hypothetical protein